MPAISYCTVWSREDGVLVREVREPAGPGMVRVSTWTDAEWFGCAQGHRSTPPTADGAAVGRYGTELALHLERCTVRGLPSRG